MYNRINLRRCARGYINSGATTNFVTGLLTNPSGTVEYLILWQVSENPQDTLPISFGYAQQGAFATTYKTQPIMPIDGPPPGILSSGNETVGIVADWVVGSSANSPDIWPVAIPFAVIPPGWSFKMQVQTNATGPLQMRVFWEAIFPDRLVSPYIGDPAIDP